jgi:ATP-dependent Lhr-like helicase
MPVTIAPRSAMPALLAAVHGTPKSNEHSTGPIEPQGGASREILALLRQRGALFFDEIVDQTHRLASDVERGLRDLVARGLAHADGFEGLRQLAGRRDRRPRHRRSSYGPGGVFAGTGPAGRWAPITTSTSSNASDAQTRDDLAERIANTLLLRYGVIFRDLMERERITLAWRDILKALRRLEARGSVRGGRFVSGFIGEQYALPQAVAALRATRRKPRTGEQVYVSAVDPCNLIGIVLPGAKVAARPDAAVLLVDGAEPTERTTPGVAWPDQEPVPPLAIGSN